MARRLRVLLLSLLLVLALPCVAWADDVPTGPADKVWEYYDSTSINKNMLYHQILGDLAWRYYNSPNPDQLKPVRVSPDAQGIARPLDDFATYEQFMAYWSLNWGEVGVYGVTPYELFTQDGLSTWKVTDRDALEQYTAWYNYFEGVTTGGGAEPVEGVYYVDLTWAKFPKSASSNTQRTNNILVDVNYNSSSNTYSGGTSTQYYTNRRQTSYSPIWPESFQVRIKSSLIDDTTSYDYLVIYGEGGVNSSAGYCYLYPLPIGSYQIVSNDSGDMITLSQSVDCYQLYYTQSRQPPNCYSDGIYFSCANYIIARPNYACEPGTYALNSRLSQPAAGTSGYYGFVGGSSGGNDNPEPVIPPRDPSPDPEVDEPSGPTITIGDFVPTVNFDNDTTTTTADLEPLLKALRDINDNIMAYGDDIRDDIWEFQNLLRDMYDSWVDFFGDWMKTALDYLGGWLKQIKEELTYCHLYLQRIWYKIGDGQGSRPDVTDDPDATGNWWDSILQQLLSLLPQAVQDFVGALSSLSGVFPFSLPWDISAILALLSHEPVTPVLDLDMGVWDAHLDFRQWDATATVFRQACLLYFAMHLIGYTQKALEGLRVI